MMMMMMMMMIESLKLDLPSGHLTILLLLLIILFLSLMSGLRKRIGIGLQSPTHKFMLPHGRWYKNLNFSWENTQQPVE